MREAHLEMRLPIPSREYEPWETTTLIGGTCKRGNAFSGPVLIARGLDFEHCVWSYGVLRVRANAQRPDKFGGHSGGETPLPIPNREVKPACADGTRRAPSRESRLPPIYLSGSRAAAPASL